MNPLQELRQRYKQLAKNLPHPARQDYEAACQRELLPKGYYLCRQGAICRQVATLESGSARVFHLKGTTEVSTAFLFPGDFVTSFQSFYLQVPSQSAIQLMEESQVTLLSYQTLQKLKATYREIDEIDRLSNDYYTMWLEERIFSLQFHSATERYADLLHNEPHLVQKVPLSYIASYLGITLETLSRIRAKVS
ncbi:Crp/Fnr family transcriptional regulator [Rhodocytophaga aerolata]|uniref:Crp/Fnr family transcriptional regulator n=1 Tax=Rhodocytophaga aerolata TaxID=455078 RepID=A0ABT8RKW6_9BACT|nr:Crp/Fnr family transcriptional regulator [Rhodocytophaga aerolata]MDO1451870.1 Crp/Fnr family transcriptional regulator [Rhodocytophaga aerolata]